MDALFFFFSLFPNLTVQEYFLIVTVLVNGVYIFLTQNRITFLIRTLYTLNHHASVFGTEEQLNIYMYLYAI